MEKIFELMEASRGQKSIRDNSVKSSLNKNSAFLSFERCLKSFLLYIVSNSIQLFTLNWLYQTTNNVFQVGKKDYFNFPLSFRSFR